VVPVNERSSTPDPRSLGGDPGPAVISDGVHSPPASAASGGGIGAPVERLEDAPLLTGNGRFMDDLDPLPGTMEAAIVRSPHPHARIRSFDADRARSMPGVVAVIGPEETAELRPFSLSVPAPLEYRPAATDRVRYVGEPVAVVVATDRYLAEDAAERVQVDYEILPTVVSVHDAMAPDAERLHAGTETNVATDRTITFGDPDGAFARAERVVRGEFSFPRYSSTPIECYGVIAEYERDDDGDRVTAWSNFHGPFVLQPLIAGVLGLSPSRVRLIVPADVGGSFGIKSAIYPYIALMALASKHAGVPVRWTEDRIEHLLASSAGNDREMVLEAAVGAEGRIEALRLDLVDNVGAYLRPPEPATLYRCYANLMGAYDIPAIALRARAVVTNKAPTGLNRGFGGQQLYFGLERLMDKTARELDVDPAELRRRNFIRREAFPYETATGGRYDSGDYEAALDLVLERSDYEGLRAEQRAARAEGRLMGIGMATIVDPSGTNIGYVSVATPPEDRKPGRDKSGSTEHVRISVDAVGDVTVMLGTTPQGQGHATVARQVVADRLGLDPARVRAVIEMDTAVTPWTVTSGSYSSRFSPLTTSALVDAADQIASTVRAAATSLLGAPADELELAGGQVRVAADPDRAVPFRYAAGLVHWDPGSMPEGVEPSLYAHVAFAPPEVRHPSADDQINSSLCYGFVAEIVLVDIDPETLTVKVRSLSSVHDCGTILNLMLVNGQTVGSIAHGLGGATLEELRYAPDGQPSSASFLDYLCPTSGEMAFDLSLDHVVTPSPFTRLGAKGSGEGSSMSIPVAIANAVTDALSPFEVEVDSLPVHGSVVHDLAGSKLPAWRERAGSLVGSSRER
jgi:2-furoyl-CoA dehydrogenase large subunit